MHGRRHRSEKELMSSWLSLVLVQATLIFLLPSLTSFPSFVSLFFSYQRVRCLGAVYGLPVGRLYEKKKKVKSESNA